MKKFLVDLWRDLTDFRTRVVDINSFFYGAYFIVGVISLLTLHLILGLICFIIAKIYHASIELKEEGKEVK